MFHCPRWDCDLVDVTEHQQEDCEHCGMDCYVCMEEADTEEES